MRLTEIKKEEFTDEEIQNIVYSNIEDNEKNTEYGLVFGNSNLIKERVTAAVFAYKNKRVKKLIFSGGTNGISNEEKDIIPEAIKMRDLAVQLGVKKEDILIDTEANNSFENVENAFKIINSYPLTSLAIITSEFHLKRCMAIIKKKRPTLEVIMIPAKDGYSDSDNWFLSDMSWNSGRSLATYEANLLIKYAKENKIEDVDIPHFDDIKKM